MFTFSGFFLFCMVAYLKGFGEKNHTELTLNFSPTWITFFITIDKWLIKGMMGKRLENYSFKAFIKNNVQSRLDLPNLSTSSRSSSSLPKLCNQHGSWMVSVHLGTDVGFFFFLFRITNSAPACRSIVFGKLNNGFTPFHSPSVSFF